VPSKWLQWLRVGSAFNFKVDETGDVLQAKVERISAAVDAVSQTVKVVASVPKSPANVLPGMSGRVLLDGGQAAAEASARSAALPPQAVAPVSAPGPKAR
jgi:multidrug efflux pump subunit AcrA (membrane-fusion protein)